MLKAGESWLCALRAASGVLITFSVEPRKHNT